MEKKLDLTFAQMVQRKRIRKELKELEVDRTEGIKAAREYLAEERVSPKEIVLDFLGAIGVFGSIVALYFIGCMM